VPCARFNDLPPRHSYGQAERPEPLCRSTPS
jgi:hypothetical protein